MRPDLPAAVDDVVARAMAKAPEDRYGSCHDLVRDLELALDVAVQLPGTTRTSRRAAANHARAAEDAASGNGSAGAETETGAGAEAGSAPDRTSGWVSHPSFPPRGDRAGAGAADAAGDPDAAPDQDLTYVPGGDDAPYAESEAGWDADEEESWTRTALPHRRERRRRGDRAGGC